MKVMEQRQLTGNWYLKRTIWGTYRVMVEVYHSGYIRDTIYKKAKVEDIVELGLYCNKYKD